MTNGEHGRLDLGVVVGIVGREERDRLPVDGPEPRCRVGDLGANEQRDDCGEDVDADAPQAGPAVPAARREARADHEVRATLEQRLEQTRDLARIVLPVSVDLDGNLEPVLEGVLVPGLNRSADSDIEGKVHDGNPGRQSNLRRRVGRGVVHHDDLELGLGVPNLLEHRPDRVALVVSRDDRERPEPPLSARGRGLPQGLGRRCHLSG